MIYFQKIKKITYKNGFLEPGQSHQDEQPHQPLQVDLPVVSLLRYIVICLKGP